MSDKKFYQLNYQERLADLPIDEPQKEVFQKYADPVFENLTENYLTSFPVPVGLLRKILVDQQEHNVPIATEEPSVVAAANKGAKLLGNVTTSIEDPMLIRAQILTAQDPIEIVDDDYQTLYQLAQDSQPNLYQRGGGLVEMAVRQLEGGYYSVDLYIDVLDAMGANIANTIAEKLANFLREKGINVITAIVSNYATESLVTAKAEIELDEEIGYRLAQLSEIGSLDVYRAVTDNKGFLNGASGVVQATGNDYRAFEAGVHAYASQSGQYQAVTKWHYAGGSLFGEVTIPVMLGTLGGTINVHPVAQANLKLIGAKTANQLAQIVTAVGLAQNFAALYALVTTGIQAGHMKMQRRAIEGQDGK